MNESINFSRFHPLTDNHDLIYEWMDLVINNGDLVDEIDSNSMTYRVFELKDDFFGLRVVTNTKKDIISFNPIFDFPKPTDTQIKGVSVLEDNAHAIITTKKDSAIFSSFLTNYTNIVHHLPKLLDQKIFVSFAGWAQSLEKQLNPPQIKQQDGSLVTTKGSSIFYNVEGGIKPYEFVYQFNVEDQTSFIWNDFIEIIQIKSTLFRTENEKIELYLYGTERILQNTYYPKRNDDIMGIMDLNSLTM